MFVFPTLLFRVYIVHSQAKHLQFRVAWTVLGMEEDVLFQKSFGIIGVSEKHRAPPETDFLIDIRGR